MTVLVRSGSVAGSRRYALELVRPSSVVVAGGGSESATISALGSVDFANATSLSLNDVFSARYDNYMISVRHTGSVDSGIGARLRAAASDAAAANYVYQYLIASSTSVSGARGTSQTRAIVGSTDSSLPNGDMVYVYGPNLVQPTAFRNVNVRNESGAYIADFANTHSLSTAYDGITIIPDSGNITGNIAVYGLRG